MSYAPPIPPRPQGWTPTPPSQTPLPPLPPRRQIWQPAPDTTWNYVLAHRVRLDHTISQADVWIIDLFDNTASDVAALHAQGRKVIAYFSAGTYENWRSDAGRFPKGDLGRKLDDWEGERWVRTGSAAVREIMLARLDLAAEKGFDGVDPDNVDGFDNKNGLGLGEGDAVDYVRFLAAEARRRGLATGLKNGGAIVERVVGDVQFCVQEQCAQYGDEEDYRAFVRSGKPVFHVEYPKGEDEDDPKCNDSREVDGKKVRKCMKAKGLGYSTIIKNIKLDQWVQYV
ncbi:hypothetical protein CAC42_6371 [Sphaceloma murrayae]|uniref:alpha-galactosidase n=1 Tax=Sphaceloma murrayae TaxID=2082308 RepID=A0A2K1QM84_9PEZI|nr:hypothetical protein CAC42_6371 [Sphaceloma murrayae]